ncbi:predicted protein [Uncinocarpus reesii 1704]|uniref:Uncharacterized protein n=1 Tax=Uncinocarpus reesii (strain UAMH 1704) TaxID=336963 RepID=C4JP41_UNCRE|nr:uncharacterized protein UREG_03100 [Uncinocarpus reesii 1704]EEP78255.1 predicted protein [Uncinocarpus reesii 1704]
MLFFCCPEGKKCARCKAQHRPCLPSPSSPELDRVIALRGSLAVAAILGRPCVADQEELVKAMEKVLAPIKAERSAKASAAAKAGIEKRRAAKAEAAEEDEEDEEDELVVVEGFDDCRGSGY